MTALFVVVLWVHVFCMTFWLGSAIFGTLLGGQASVQEAIDRHPMTRGLSSRLQVAFPIAIVLGVLSGIILATVFGAVRSLAAIATPYGATVLAAFVLVVVAVLTGPLKPPALARLLPAKLPIGEVSLVLAFTCMMLMRVGL